MRKLITAAIVSVPLAGAMAMASPQIAQASSPGCGPSTGCGTFTGTDAAGRQISLDAKWQESAPGTKLIGYRDHKDDQATSFILIRHGNGGTVSYSLEYAPHGIGTDRCVTAVRGGQLVLEPCARGRDLAQDFAAFAAQRGSSRSSRQGSRQDCIRTAASRSRISNHPAPQQSTSQHGVPAQISQHTAPGAVRNQPRAGQQYGQQQYSQQHQQYSAGCTSTRRGAGNASSRYGITSRGGSSRPVTVHARHRVPAGEPGHARVRGGLLGRPSRAHPVAR